MYDEYPSLSQKIKSLDLGYYLEFGCGEGAFLNFVLTENKSSRSVTAVDINADSIAKAKLALENHDIRFIEEASLPLDLDSGLFDTITLSNTIHHLKDVEGVLDELKRLVKPKGRIIITEMVSDGLSEAEKTYYRLHTLRADVDRLNGIHHEATYSSHQIEELVIRAKLLVVNSDILHNSKQAAAEEVEISEISAILDDLVGEKAGQYPYLWHEAEEIKIMLRQHGIKRPRQIYLETTIEN